MSIKQPPHQPEEGSKHGRQGSIVVDAELAAMNRITKLLNALEPIARWRVLAWLQDRYAIPQPTMSKGPGVPDDFKVVP